MREFFDRYKFKYNAADVAPDTVAWEQYSVLLDEYQKTHGGALAKKIKKRIIQWSALFVPGRELRGRWRKFLSKKLKYEK